MTNRWYLEKQESGAYDFGYSEFSKPYFCGSIKEIAVEILTSFTNNKYYKIADLGRPNRLICVYSLTHIMSGLDQSPVLVKIRESVNIFGFDKLEFETELSQKLTKLKPLTPFI
jgi:hypothetical protein